MPGKFELYKDKKGEFRYRLKAANGQIVLVGEGYKAKASLVKGVESVRKNAATDKRFEQKASKSGKAYFVLKATNGQVIGQSEQYESEAACKGGIASVMKCACDAVVDDQTA